MNHLPGEKLHSGDVLLVQGTWSNIARLNNEDERWVVLGQPLKEAAKVTLDYKAPVAAAIMLVMIAMMVFDFIPVEPVTAVMIAAVLMVLAGCFRNVETAYKTINWESIVLIAAMMPMSVALEKTGASTMISHSLVNGLAGVAGPAGLLAGVIAHDVHKQYGYCRAHGSHSPVFGNGVGRQSVSFPFCSGRGCEHVLCFSVFNASQCAGNAGRALYVHGLRKGGLAVAADNGHSNGARAAFAVPVLSISFFVGSSLRIENKNANFELK